LLALGALELGREPIENRRSAILGRNRQRAYARGTGQEGAPIGPLSGLLGGLGRNAAPRGTGDPLRRGGRGDTKFNESGAIFYGGGDLSATNFLNARYQQDLQTQQEVAAQRRTATSAGPGYLNAALNREKFELAKSEMEEQQARSRMFFSTVVDTAATDAQQELLRNPFIPTFLRDEISQKIFSDRVFGAQEAAGSPVIAADVELRGQAWLEMEPSERAEVLNIESQTRTTRETLRFMTDTTAASRALQPEETARVMSQYAITSMNFLRGKFQAGAMQKADLDLFEELAGDPNRWLQLTAAERGRVVSLLETMTDDLSIVNRKYGLTKSGEGNLPPPVSPTSGATLEPVGVNEIVQGARERAGVTEGATAGESVPLWMLGQGGFGGGPGLSPGGT